MTDKKKKRSRWTANSGIPRYTDAELSDIAKKYSEQTGWRKAAKVTKR